MKTFKEYFTEANEEGKGAFKEFPINQQPQRIPIAIYPKLAEYINQTLLGYNREQALEYINNLRNSNDKI